ncbi:hypothetical protein K4H28_04360 [Deefgea tanakiae]|uniref:Uncharacterized protein n=1 Tax=Deefgea tanakiae TaxID=2865840 RepID=A0ABX8Z7U6_9NEIS|nr:hypothetical protein [Deefgea tanakiae]QZA78648.1 hypothetical protein K4H28_04360 [Deefgea tanakiae]
MGGFGSGRNYSYSSKAKTSDYRFVDIRRWQRDGMLSKRHFDWSWHRNGERVASITVKVAENAITLQYRIKRNGEWQDVDCKIKLSKTACNLGGSRQWFICPCCNRRAAIIYIGKVPACRKCYRLSYSSQHESHLERQIRKLDKIRDQLRWPAGFLNGESGKPKGMHWKTYNSLYQQQATLSNQAESYVDAQLGLINKGMERVTKSISKRIT